MTFALVDTIHRRNYWSELFCHLVFFEPSNKKKIPTFINSSDGRTVALFFYLYYYFLDGLVRGQPPTRGLHATIPFSSGPSTSLALAGVQLESSTSSTVGLDTPTAEGGVNIDIFVLHLGSLIQAWWIAWVEWDTATRGIRLQSWAQKRSHENKQISNYYKILQLFFVFFFGLALTIIPNGKYSISMNCLHIFIAINDVCCFIHRCSELWWIFGVLLINTDCSLSDQFVTVPVAGGDSGIAEANKGPLDASFLAARFVHKKWRDAQGITSSNHKAPGQTIW